MKKEDHEKYAKKILKQLVAHVLSPEAKREQNIYYGKLAMKLNYPVKVHNFRLFGKRIGETLNKLHELVREIAEDAPPIVALVVAEKDDLPSNGFSGGHLNYANLALAEKRDYIQTLRSQIFDYNMRWLDVLAGLHIDYQDLQAEINANQNLHTND